MTQTACTTLDAAAKPKTKTLLLVDDSDVTRVATKWFLTNFGYAVDSVRSAEEGLALFDPRIHDLVITDHSMPGMSGAEMAHIIKLRSPGTPIVMHTSSAPDERSCIDLVILKPLHVLAFKEAIETILAEAHPAPAQIAVVPTA